MSLGRRWRTSRLEVASSAPHCALESVRGRRSAAPGRTLRRNPLYVFVANGPVSGFPDEIDQVTLAAQTDANGLRLVNSSCSDQWQQPLKLAAKSQGGDLSVEFLTGLVAWGGPESQALTAGVTS